MEQAKHTAESASLLAMAMDSSHLGMVLSDARCERHPVVFANDAYLALTGFARHEVLGRDVRLLHGEAAQTDSLQAALKAGKPLSTEILSRRKDGSEFWDGLELSPVHGADGTVSHFLGVHADITARRDSERSLRRSEERLRTDAVRDAGDLELALQQRTALLHEVDHRVKNNLQLIASLLLLQSRRIESADTRAALRSMLERVNAVATVHRRLFRSEDLERFDVAEFVRDLAADLAGGVDRQGITVTLDLEPVAVPASQAAPLALVISELISNALKHGFPDGRAGTVTAALRRGPDAFEVTVTDDGVGCEGAAPGFGLTIVKLLCQQLRGLLTSEAMQPGCRVTVRVPLSHSAEP